MPCKECADGHWECGEDPSELCQGVGEEYQRRMMSQAAQGGETMPASSGGWTKLGEFVTRFEVFYRMGYDGKPVVRIEPKIHRPQRSRAVNNGPVGSGSRDE